MLLPDDLIIKKNCSKSMIASHKNTKLQWWQVWMLTKILLKDGVSIILIKN
jgi:hypothetical protein